MEFQRHVFGGQDKDQFQSQDRSATFPTLSTWTKYLTSQDHLDIITCLLREYGLITISCGEEKLVCQNCLRRGEECHFLGQPLQPSVSPGSPSPSSSPNMLDIELLHNFAISTYTALTDDPRIRDLWQGRVVKLCFKCEYDMLALLSVSALHLSQFSVLLNKLARQWWLDGWINYLVDKIYYSLDEERRTWIGRPMEGLRWLSREE